MKLKSADSILTLLTKKTRLPEQPYVCKKIL